MQKFLIRLLLSRSKAQTKRRTLALGLSEQILRRALRRLRSKPEIVYRTELRAGERFEIVSRKP